LRTPLVFSLKPENLNNTNWWTEATKVGADAPPPPQAEIKIGRSGTIDHLDHDAASITRFGQLDFAVPDGYWLDSATAKATLAVHPAESVDFRWLGGNSNPVSVPNFGTPIVTGDLLDLNHRSGALSASYLYAWVSFANLNVLMTFKPTPETFLNWQHAAWRVIRTAAEARHQEEMARLQEERDQLWRALVGKDTLSLRRLEREEMLRLIMLWLIGPDTTYANAPSWIESTVNQMLNSEIAFLGGAAPTTPSPSSAGIDGKQWSKAILFGDLVKFVQQAVEWENLLYFYYPYFWGGEGQGRDKMLFEHPDPEHQNFLRAGYCRVVITVRPGFEEDFTRLVETGSLGGTYTSPYLTIAEEIANSARTNYAGIPPANPEKHARPLLYPQQRSTWATMELVIAAIEKHKLDNGDYPATLAALPVGLNTKDAWDRPLIYTNPGSGNDYDLISLGSDGAVDGEGTDADISAAAGASLMASWFDYTPTSGIDIVVNSMPDVIA
jgi:Type II secretion system (T2SS), protein G